MFNRAGFRNKVMPAILAGVTLAATVGISVKAADTPPAEKPHIDLAFCIDTTGSMQNEIDSVKAKTKEIVAKLAGAQPAPVIRVGIVAFRDRGDEYVTKVFPFSEDIDKVVKDISSLVANGGGDGPEAVNSALHSAVSDLHWSTAGKTLKLLFLIGDAGPNSSDTDFNWRTEAKSAISKGIQINTLACDGLQSFPEDTGSGVFKEIARLADGKFEQLTYKQEVVNKGGTRETIVSSGGKSFKVRAKDADAWKSGADALSAMGEAEAVPAARPSAARSFSGGFAGGAAAGMGFYGKAADAVYAPSVSRKESNLADIVLERTKKQAEEKLNVKYK